MGVAVAVAVGVLVAVAVGVLVAIAVGVVVTVETGVGVGVGAAPRAISPRGSSRLDRLLISGLFANQRDQICVSGSKE